MTANRIIQHIFQQPDLQQVEEAALEQLVREYPYFTAARLLLARKNYSRQHNLLTPAVKKAQACSNNLHYFYRFVTGDLEKTVAGMQRAPEQAGAAAVAEADEKAVAVAEEETLQHQPAVTTNTVSPLNHADEADEWDEEEPDAIMEDAARAIPGPLAAAEVKADVTGGVAEETGAAPAEEDEGPIKIFPLEMPAAEETLTFQPLYTEDYFAYKRLKDPAQAEELNEKGMAEMKSFTAWLKEMKHSFAEKASKGWYHQQLHRMYEDDEPEVSEAVEKMAIDSITMNDDVVSETLAEVWARQHQYQTAIQIYQKLSLLNPAKSAYFAQKIKELQLLTEKN